MMPRRRSVDPTIAISVTLPRSLLDKIDDELTRTSSRSLWITNACKARLDDSKAMDFPTRQLMAMLHARVADDEGLRAILLDRLSNSNR